MSAGRHGRGVSQTLPRGLPWLLSLFSLSALSWVTQLGDTFRRCRALYNPERQAQTDQMELIRKNVETKMGFQTLTLQGQMGKTDLTVYEKKDPRVC